MYSFSFVCIFVCIRGQSSIEYYIFRNHLKFLITKKDPVDCIQQVEYIVDVLTELVLDLVSLVQHCSSVTNEKLGIAEKYSKINFSLRQNSKVCSFTCSHCRPGEINSQGNFECN